MVKIIYLTADFKTKIPSVKRNIHVSIITCQNFNSIQWLTKRESSFYKRTQTKQIGWHSTLEKWRLLPSPWNALTSSALSSKNGARQHQVSGLASNDTVTTPNSVLETIIWGKVDHEYLTNWVPYLLVFLFQMVLESSKLIPNHSKHKFKPFPKSKTKHI